MTELTTLGDLSRPRLYYEKADPHRGRWLLIGPTAGPLGAHTLARANGFYHAATIVDVAAWEAQLRPG